MYHEHFEDCHSLIMNSAIGIHLVDKDGYVIYANQSELETLGYTHEEYVGHHVSEFQMDEDVLTDILRRLCNNESLSNYPSRVQGKHEIIYTLYHSNVYYEDGEFIHTRCYGSSVGQEAFDVFKRNSEYNLEK